MATNLSSCFFYSIFRTTEVSSKLYFVKIVKSQRRYDFLITKELIFGFQILDLKDHFSASLKSLSAGMECREEKLSKSWQSRQYLTSCEMYVKSVQSTLSPLNECSPSELWLFLMKMTSSWHDLINKACPRLPNR